MPLIPDATRSMVPGSGTTGGLGEQEGFFFFPDAVAVSAISIAAGFGFLTGSHVPGMGGEKKPGKPVELIGPIGLEGMPTGPCGSKPKGAERVSSADSKLPGKATCATEPPSTMGFSSVSILGSSGATTV